MVHERRVGARHHCFLDRFRGAGEVGGPRRRGRRVACQLGYSCIGALWWWWWWCCCCFSTYGRSSASVSSDYRSRAAKAWSTRRGGGAGVLEEGIVGLVVAGVLVGGGGQDRNRASVWMGWAVQRVWMGMWIRQRNGDILERLLARSATEAVRWTGAGRLCGRGRGRSVAAVVVSTVYLGRQSPNLLRASPDTLSNKLCGALSYGLRQSMLRSVRLYGEHGTADELTRMLLRVLRVLLLLREEEVRLGGAIGLPKGGHG